MNLERTPNTPQENEPKGDIKFIRHSKAGYKSFGEVIGSDNPDRSIDVKEQVLPDLTESSMKITIIRIVSPQSLALIFVYVHMFVLSYFIVLL